MADAFDVIVHKGVVGETYNIGTNEERSVIQVADDICAHFNLDPHAKVEYVQNRLFNDRRYVVGLLDAFQGFLRLLQQVFYQ